MTMKCYCGTADNRQHTHLCDMLNERDAELSAARQVVEAVRVYLKAPVNEVDVDETELFEAEEAMEAALEAYDKAKLERKGGE